MNFAACMFSLTISPRRISTQNFRTGNPRIDLRGVVVGTDVRFEKVENGYRGTFIDAETECHADRLRWERDELFGQLSISCGLIGARATDNGLVSFGTFNFSSTRARRERAREIAERVRSSPKLDFLAMLEELCQRILTAERVGDPAILLRDTPCPPADDEYDLLGFRFPKRHPTILFGDGGTAKSLFGLYLVGALAAEGLSTALFDWELDGGQHRRRLGLLFGNTLPPVRYVRCERPLIHEADRLRRIIRDAAIDFAVFDSIGFACPGPPEAAEHATGYFRANRSLGIGSLHIAHIRQGEDNDQKPFGSAFWHNSARSTWNVKLAATAPDGHCLTLGLFHRKSNLSALRPAVGYTVAFDTTSAVITRIDVGANPDLAEHLPTWQRMKARLLGGPETLAQLAEDLRAKPETLDKTVRRKSDVFTRVAGRDGITRIALVERRSA